MSEWRPIDTLTPYDCLSVDLWYDGERWADCVWRDGKGWWSYEADAGDGGFLTDLDKVTHWMPLPSPPKDM